ncbi:discoidin domain-containing protein [Arthrobacter alpinus]|nr:discoidin domain-containing protein [Arthrobacter alpinus]
MDHALGRRVTAAGATTTLMTDGNLRTGATTGLAARESFEIDLGSAQPVDRITLTEDTLNHGQAVEKLTVEAKLGGTWTKVADIGSVGVLRIQKFSSTVTAQEFRVTVVETRAPAYFSDFSLFAQLAAAPAPVLNLYVDCEATIAGIGTLDRPYNSLEQFRQAEIATEPPCISRLAPTASAPIPRSGATEPRMHRSPSPATARGIPTSWRQVPDGSFRKVGLPGLDGCTGGGTHHSGANAGHGHC